MPNDDKNVYLLGAGFSKEIGLPLQDDFLLEAKDVFFKNPTLYKNFERVFDYQDKLTKMKKFLNYPLLNLEHLFNLIEMDAFYSNSVEVSAVKNDFIKLVCDVVKEKTPNPFAHNAAGSLIVGDIYHHYLSFVSILIRDSRNNSKEQRDSVISFNYDLVLEGAVSCINFNRENDSRLFQKNKQLIKLNTTFEKQNISVDPLSSCFKKNGPSSFFPNSDIFSTSDDSIKLIKLHGSINWRDGDASEAFIIPPTWNKSDSRIRKLWENAYEELKTARRIIIIGYSFPDSDIYVKSLLALALNENKHLQNIYFVNPDENAAKIASMSLLDKYFEKYCSFKAWTFSKFISSKEGQDFIENNLNRKVWAV